MVNTFHINPINFNHFILHTTDISHGNISFNHFILHCEYISHEPNSFICFVNRGRNQPDDNTVAI